MAVIQISKDTFSTEVRKAKSDQLVLVEFFGQDCSKCKEIAPVLQELSEDKVYQKAVKFCAIDTALNRSFAISRRVMSQPTILFYKDGIEVARLNRDQVSRDSIKQLLDEYR